MLLTVLAQHALDVARAQRGKDAVLCPTLGPGVRPRLCHVVKDEGGFGFSVTQGKLSDSQEGGQGGDCSPTRGARRQTPAFDGLPGHRGSFWLVLSPGGAAERAGVPPGARLLEVNGVSVETLTQNQLSRKVGWLRPATRLGLGPPPRARGLLRRALSHPSDLLLAPSAAPFGSAPGPCLPGTSPWAWGQGL